jgi:hypothetical protein
MSYLRNLMRHGADTFNAQFTLLADGTLAVKTTDGIAHSATSPLLVRFASGATSDLAASPSVIQITSATTFGLPAYFQGAALPIHIGIARTGATTAVLVASRNTPPHVTCDGNPTTAEDGVLSGVALSGAETYWGWTISGYKLVNGVWDFTGCLIGEGL